MLPAIERVIADGHELLAIFSFDCDNVFNFNTRAQNLAKQRGAAFILSRAEDFHITNFIDKGAEIFLAAGYPYKIPPIDETTAHAINIHPAYLPKGRGIMPVPYIIANHINEAAGLTAHKMTQTYDAGDILWQEKITLDKRESVETYNAKILMKSADITAQIFNNIDKIWNNAKPQNEKHTTQFPMPTDEMRMMDWSQNVEAIDAVGRAFGSFGSLALLDNQLWVVYDYDFWREKHGLTVGTIAAATSREITIACKDGFICLKNIQPAQI